MYYTMCKRKNKKKNARLHPHKSISMYMYHESVILYYTTYYTCIIEKVNAMLIVNVKNKNSV